MCVCVCVCVRVCSLCSHKKVIKKTSYNIKDFGNPIEGFCYTKFFNGQKKKKEVIYNMYHSRIKRRVRNVKNKIKCQSIYFI